MTDEELNEKFSGLAESLITMFREIVNTKEELHLLKTSHDNDIILKNRILALVSDTNTNTNNLALDLENITNKLDTITQELENIKQKSQNYNRQINF